MATATVLTFQGRTFTVQRVRRADKSGHAWLWAEAGSDHLHVCASRDAALLDIGAHCGLPAAGQVVEVPVFASAFDATGKVQP